MDTPDQKSTEERALLFTLFSAALLAIHFSMAGQLIEFSRQSELYDYILIIPFISAYFFYDKRRAIAAEKAYSIPGLFVLTAGVLIYLAGRYFGAALDSNDGLSLRVFSFLVLWLGGFLFFFGEKSFKSALFPLAFLAFMIPVPSAATDHVVNFLKAGSAEVAYAMLKSTGTPVVRDGYVFSLPRLSIEIAPQCSGIHSCMALLITSIVAGRLFLNTLSRRVILSLAVIPIAIFKNGVRIAALSLLAVYLDPAILQGNLHRRGGIPMFILAMTILTSVVWLLRRTEKRRA